MFAKGDARDRRRYPNSRLGSTLVALASFRNCYTYEKEMCVDPFSKTAGMAQPAASLACAYPFQPNHAQQKPIVAFYSTEMTPNAPFA
jgi:hypothetical protein